MNETDSVTYEPEECAWCKGTRKGRDGELCQICKGKGAVLVAQPPRSCPVCRGSGREGGLSDRPACNMCGGFGWWGVRQASGRSN